MKTSYFIPQQVPQHVLAEYPAFVDFIKAYYEWYDQQSLESLHNLLDIDNTVDSFIQYFKKELDEAGVLSNIDNRFYLKNIKQLYRSKGSKASFQFFFKLLYNQESEIEHPWDYTFKPSAGKWKQDTAVIVRITKGSGDLLGGNYIHITDSNGRQYSTYVHDVIQRSTDIFELFIDRFNCGIVRMAYVSSLDNSIQGEIVLSTVKAFVEESGEGFEVGQTFRINSIGGSGTVIKVNAVDSNGGIKSVEIIAFGYGYQYHFNTLLAPLQDDVLDYNVSLVHSNETDGLIGSFKYQSYNSAKIKQEFGEFVRHDYTNLLDFSQYDKIQLVEPIANQFQIGQIITGQTSKATARVYLPTDVLDLSNDVLFVKDVVGIFNKDEIVSSTSVSAKVKTFFYNFFVDGTYVGESLSGFSVNENPPNTKKQASIRFNVGCIFQYPGYYQDSTNLLDNLIFIHDSYYYQVYSYVTVTETSINVYGDTLKKILHPTGTVHFGRVKLTNSFNLSPYITSSLNLLVNPDVWLDYIKTNQLLLTFDVGRKITTEAVAFDQLSYSANYVRSMNDDLNTDPLDYIVTTESALYKTLTKDTIYSAVSLEEKGSNVEQTFDDEGKVTSVKIFDDDNNLTFGVFPGIGLSDAVSTSTSNIEFDIDAILPDSTVHTNSIFGYTWVIKYLDIINDSVSTISSITKIPTLLRTDGVDLSESYYKLLTKEEFRDATQVSDLLQPSLEPHKKPTESTNTSNGVYLYKTPTYTIPGDPWTDVGYLENEYFTNY